MLNAGDHVIDRSQIVTLEAANPRRREQAPQQDVLARAFDPAAPTLVARDVDHRREGPVDARPRGLEGRNGAVRRARSGSKLPASATGTGKIVR